MLTHVSLTYHYTKFYFRKLSVAIVMTLKYVFRAIAMFSFFCVPERHLYKSLWLVGMSATESCGSDHRIFCQAELHAQTCRKEISVLLVYISSVLMINFCGS
jgi:cytochrome b subunit of formate dehydrogenase